MKIRYLVSACLAGELCKYDGNSNFNDRVASLVHEGFGVVVCPEVMGGLNTPRIPCEIIDDKVIDQQGNDKTTEYKAGAEKTLEILNKFGVKKVIFKEKSPSCGSNKIYDGTFSHTLVDGDGITVQLLKAHGVTIYDENTNPVYDAIIVGAGSGDRCNLPYNKMFHYSGSQSMIEMSIEPFIADYLCNKVYVVCKKEERNLFETLIQSEKVEFIDGGDCREQSVYNALVKCESKYVLVHDGARPYVSDELIDSIRLSLESGHTSIIPYIEDEGNNRDFVANGKSIQTPQGFETKLLLEEMTKVKDKFIQFRDESSIISLHNDVTYISGEKSNKKITFYEDIKEFERRK